ncbi:MAG: CHASE sensor domain-containing protein [Dissulfuribacterales bacterium]
MAGFRDFSITKKLVTIVMVISSITLMMACGLVGAREVINFRKTLVHELSLLSKIVADRSTASLVFDNPKVAKETLSALKAKQSIVSAYIFKNSGIVFADYHRPDVAHETPPKLFEPQAWRFTANALLVVTPILLKGEKIGTVFIKSDLEEMYSLMWEYFAYIFLVFIAAILIAFFILSQLQRFISKPILDLAKAASLTAVNMDYSTRVTKKGNDEIGLLVDAFNTMLDQIEKRDIELSESKNNAEVGSSPVQTGCDR